MEYSTIRLTMAQAVVRWLTVQFTEIDGQRVPLFAGVFGIFGHGNVTCLSEALEAVQDQLPTWRGQNEQSMALAAVGFAKAKRRRQIMIATSSIEASIAACIFRRRASGSISSSAAWISASTRASENRVRLALP